MAVSAVAHTDAIVTRGTIGVTRLAISGGVTAGLFLVFCWLGTFLPISSPTHAYISLFTNAEISSGRALLEGGVWAALFGAVISGLFGLVHNARPPSGAADRSGSACLDSAACLRRLILTGSRRASM